MRNQVQLITYVDRLCGDLKHLKALLSGPFSGLFGGVHLLPFFDPIDGADAGFDPMDHTKVDLRIGDWNDVRALGHDLELVASKAQKSIEDMYYTHAHVPDPRVLSS